MNDQELERLNNKGLTSREIAKILNASQSGVSRALQRLDMFPAYPKEDEDRDPREIYDESKERALNWKNKNMDKVKKEFAEWQKDNRKKRNAYQLNWSKKQNGHIRKKKKTDGE
ncbi:MAG: hypothetical protein ACTSQY_09680 [Candidatus Odinarchaeia archaeon]